MKVLPPHSSVPLRVPLRGYAKKGVSGRLGANSFGREDGEDMPILQGYLLHLRTTTNTGAKRKWRWGQSRSNPSPARNCKIPGIRDLCREQTGVPTNNSAPTAGLSWIRWLTSNKWQPAPTRKQGMIRDPREIRRKRLIQLDKVAPPHIPVAG